MRWLTRFRSFTAALLFGRRADRDLHDELSLHLDLRVRDLIAQGHSPSEAANRASRELGDPARWRVEAREARGVRWIDELAADIRIARRLLARSPGSTATAVVTLALGIGATTAIFSELNAVLWRRLPVHGPEELRSLVWSSPQTGFLNTPAFQGPRIGSVETFASYSYPVYTAMREATSASFSDLACWMEPGELLPVVMGELGFGAVQFVSGNYFRTLGVQAARGRTLQPEDDIEGSPAAVAVITHRFWQRTFLGNPEVLTKTLTLNGAPFSIIGVLPEGFFGVDPAVTPDVLVPMTMLHIASAGGQGVLQTQANWSICRVIGRMRAGVTDEQARAEAEAGALRSMTTTPNWPPKGRVYQLPRISIVPADRGLDHLRNRTTGPVLIVLTGISIILVIACANIAGLLMARGTARQKEIATRLAIGASRSRLVRQLLTESVVIALLGGLAGVALAYTLTGVLPSLLSQFMTSMNSTPRTIGVGVTPDLRVLGFAAVVTVAAGLIFGVLPAVRATRVNLIAQIKQARPSAEGMRDLLGGKVLVAVQVALSMTLLVAAGLFIRTVGNLQTVNLGYRTDRLLYVRVEPRGGGVRVGSDGLSPGDSQRRRAAFFEDVVKHLSQTPGVLSAAASVNPPLSDYGGAGDSDALLNACTRDLNPQDPGEATYEPSNLVSPGFFETMQLPLLLGRDFTWAERELGRQRVVIVNEAFVKKFFAPGRNPIGETVGFGRDCPSKPGFATIVGVAADSRAQPRHISGPTVYQMYGSPARPLTIILRTTGEPRAVLPALRESMARFNASVPLFGEVSAADLLNQQIRQERLLTGLLMTFGAFALLLCCLGIFGLLSYMVGGRTPEIGLRLAIGAQRSDVIALVIGESLRPVVIGVAVGIGTALVTSRALESMLFGVSRVDPLSISAAAGIFVAIAAVAAAVPARRAARLEPVSALRCE